MQIHDGIVAAIGNTPLIKLERASAATGCTILGKAEFMNPGQSVKDRAALFIIQDAVKKGELRPGGVRGVELHDQLRLDLVQRARDVLRGRLQRDVLGFVFVSGGRHARR